MSMDRRSLVKGLSSLVLSAAITKRAIAESRCDPSPWGMRCAKYISFDQIAHSYSFQNMDQWCWAACISMIFKFYGFDVSQIMVVQQAYGTIVNAPGNWPQILGALNRSWVDSHGDSFSVRTGALFAPQAGAVRIDNEDLLDSLDQDKPILFCNSHHAMILTALEYFDTPMGPNIVKGWVMDPWPTSGGLHPVAPQDMRPPPFGDIHMLATIEVE
jgi:hypothetical protein